MSIRQRWALAIGAAGWACAGAPAWADEPANAPATTFPVASTMIAQTASSAALATSLPGLSLAKVLQAARDNLEVRLASHAVSAARAELEVADHAPLPNLTGKVGSIDLQNGIGAGNPLTRKRLDKSVGIDWTWERGDKRALRAQAARYGVSAASADLEDARSDQSLAALAAYFDLLGAQQRVQWVRDIEQGSSELSRTTARRLQAGDVSSQEASRVEIEVQRARADLTTSERDVRIAALTLAQLIGAAVPGDTVLQPDWPMPPSTADWPAPVSALIDQRPDVRAGIDRLRGAQSALDGALAMRRTDVTWGASVDHFPGTSNRLVELRVQIPLQWGYSYGGEIGRAQSQVDQALDALGKVRRDATAEMERLQIEASSAAQRHGRYLAEIVPRARQVAEMAELAYRKGAMSLTDLLDARRTLRSTLLEANDAHVDEAKAVGAWQLRNNDAAVAPRTTSPSPPP